MEKHKIERKAPADCRVPKNIPKPVRYRTIAIDPPWTHGQTGNGKYSSAQSHYDLMSLERIKNLPIADLADENAHLYLWVQNGNINEGLELMKAWGFRYISVVVWVKIRNGLGNYWRNATEVCLFGVRGKLPPKCKNQGNFLISMPTQMHSEKPREFTSMIERVSPGPYLEMFCRRRPASSEKWDCWGNETEGGADIYIPGYPVPKYSFEKSDEAESHSGESGEEV